MKTIIKLTFIALMFFLNIWLGLVFVLIALIAEGSKRKKSKTKSWFYTRINKRIK